MQVTIDDTSPQILYHGSKWNPGLSTDAYLSRYYNSSFHGTWTQDDSASFTFRGSEVKIYGAKRDNHGAYACQIDGSTPQTFDGRTTHEDQEFQAVLYSVTDLDPTVDHTVTIINTPNNTTPKPSSDSSGNSYWLDIDAISITVPINGMIQTLKYDDHDPLFEYSPGWTGFSDSPSAQNRYNASSHLSVSYGQTIDFTFSGQSVQLFGALNTDHGPYSVELDGGVAETYNGSYVKYFSPVSLYLKTGLEDTVHTLRLTNLAVGFQALDFDYALVNTTQSSVNTASIQSAAALMPSSSSSSPASASTTSVSTTMMVATTSSQSHTSTTLTTTATSSTFSMLRPTTNISDASNTSKASSPSSSVNITAAVLGSVAGGLVLVFLLVAILFIRKRNKHLRQQMIDAGFSEYPARSEYTIERDDSFQNLDLRNGGKGVNKGSGFGYNAFEARPLPSDRSFEPSVSLYNPNSRF